MGELGGGRVRPARSRRRSNGAKPVARGPVAHDTIAGGGLSSDAALAQLAPGDLPQVLARSDTATRAGIILRLQRMQGNAQVQRIIQDGSATPLADGPIQRAPSVVADKPLTSPRFADSTRLQKAHHNQPAMRIGEPDADAVVRIQQALLDDGFDMPISTKKTGKPDGIYGRETYKVVKAFQSKYGLNPDGVVGRLTLDKLDELYSGPPPAPKPPEIESTEEALGEHVKNDMVKVNDPASFGPASGVWYDYNYLAEHKKRPDLYPWDEDWRLGKADPAYWDRVDQWDWVLKPGVSASDGIKAWLNGLTIAECQVTIVAIELETLRAAVGDDKFDAHFGSPKKAIPASKRLHVKTGKGSSADGLLVATDAAAKGDAGTANNRPVKVGEWYYFYNHPKYLLKHPGGAFQGENSIYMGLNSAGQQTWEGLGSGRVTEAGMLDVMVADYNRPRDDEDARAIVGIRAQNGGKLPAKYILEADGGTEFHDSLGSGQAARDKILNEDQGYEIDGRARTGGFLSTVGKKLDVAKVNEIKNE